MTIDIERLREDLKQDSYGAFFAGGYGAALMEALDIDSATPEQLIELAKDRGFDLRRYAV